MCKEEVGARNVNISHAAGAPITEKSLMCKEEVGTRDVNIDRAAGAPITEKSLITQSADKSA